MLRRKDPTRSAKIIGSAILTGLSLVAFAISRDEKAFLCFVFVIIGSASFIKAWTAKSIHHTLSKTFEHPDRTYKG